MLLDVFYTAAEECMQYIKYGDEIGC